MTHFASHPHACDVSDIGRLPRPPAHPHATPPVPSLRRAAPPRRQQRGQPAAGQGRAALQAGEGEGECCPTRPWALAAVRAVSSDRQARELLGGHCTSCARCLSAQIIVFYNMLPNGEIDHMSLHGGCPVIAGEKWAANKWCVHAPHKRPAWCTRGPVFSCRRCLNG
eukprot:COSAG01_NODE_6327_length_3734_cov_1.460523_3_plen_167_part_00